MDDTPGLLSAAQMERVYGALYRQGFKLPLDRGKVPERFWPLVPYAAFIRIADDLTREALVDDAPADAK